jgi:uncharacterized OB-fold protein
MSGRKPVITSSAAQHFWDECAKGHYLLQQCTNCETFRYPPGPICWNCAGDGVKWVESPGRGTIFTFTTISRAPSEDFKPYLPYTVALVDLDEGPRVMGNVIDCAPEDIAIDARVEVAFQDVGDAVLPQFTLTGATSS